VVGDTYTDNRGIRRRGYYVLRRTSIPAVLVECGFLTNPIEARLALQGTYRQKLAERIADGVMGKRPPPNRPVVAGLTHVVPPVSTAGGYNDFVRAEGERSNYSSHSSKRRRSHTKSSSSRKKSSRSKKSSSSSSSSKKKKKKKKSSSESNE
jgi:hypothetical protein